MPDFLPRSDSDLLYWSMNFDQRLSSDPDKYNVPADWLAEFQQLQQQFAAAFTIAIAPSTRTQGNIIAKQAARAAMAKVARRIQMRIKANSDLTDTDLLSLGLKIRRVGKAAKLPTLTKPPSVTLLSRDERTATVQMSDPLGRIRRRPRGTTGAMLMIAVGDSVSASTRWINQMATSKTIATIDLPANYPVGTPIMISIQWISTRGYVGPRAIISTWIAGGSSVAA